MVVGEVKWGEVKWDGDACVPPHTQTHSVEGAAYISICIDFGRAGAFLQCICLQTQIFTVQLDVTFWINTRISVNVDIAVSS